MSDIKPVVLICIDGWGLADHDLGNAIKNTETPVMDGFKKDVAWAELNASGLAVGLPDGLMGNSEVGHLNIGAGRPVFQDIVRIDMAVANKTMGQEKVLVDAFNRAKAGNGRLHYLGLVSDGGVHSHINHLIAMIEAAKDAGVPHTFVQAFTDGRDTPPTSGTTHMEKLFQAVGHLGYGRVATIMGRYYAMDRDKRWERIEVAWNGMVKGQGEASADGLATMRARYAANETDEFLKPIILNTEGCIKDGDTLVFFNYRSDRMREIVETFAMQRNFTTDTVPADVSVTCMTEYKEGWTLPVIFGKVSLTNCIGEYLASRGIKQFHTAETEKYAHVTFFFNGGREEPFEGEEREMVASPKVATYDLAPEMNAVGVKDSVIRGMRTGKYPFIVCNFAPPDMVGHTGQYEPARVAVRATDACIGEIYAACRETGYTLFITADHGNAEVMIDLNDKTTPFTAHTSNPVPFVMCTPGAKFSRPAGVLADVAPTVLSFMGLPVPADMTGASML